MKSQEICPRFEAAISLLGQRWTGLIIYQLMDGSKRFGQLTEEIGISGRLLSERLKTLEGDGLVERIVYPETPVRIEYSLTEKGASLQPVMKEIERWSQNWIETAEKAESTP
ncbi:HxlR family transcriptional regulator [Planococcus rifietoensis]|uniref:HxlR family transcriptional regulator n=1 Tax=Planococcus rifietoensis TaxID=200991 RepID=A0A0U2Z5R1_9BACL|nr:helix-turn-helix domain-containing protein [Planococcus rifietoensis]ALS75211.1 HxlR family transcriptional regulator [Planococcus rifietoensis]